MPNSSQGLTSIEHLSDRALMIILDGFGIGDDKNKNAIVHAQKKNFDYYFSHYPFTTIEAGGEAVGLPKGVTGNSEVGHMNLGAGRPVRQDLVRINEAIENKSLESQPKLQELIANCKKSTKRLHLMGLLSDGGVHSHINHLIELIKILSKHHDIKIYFHAFMDGRDTPRDSGLKYIKQLEKEFSSGQFIFASMQGRSIGMDRDRRWPKIELAYKTMTGLGNIQNITPEKYIQEEYSKEIYDEFITPVLFDKSYAIENGDSLFFINFRPDRAGQITLAFTWDKFKEFQIPIRPSYFLCMTPYVPDEVELPILFDKEKIRGGLTEYLASLGKKQFKIAETEKYAHVTYFFNGGEKKPFKNEEHVLIPSPKDIATYDQKPQMSAPQVTEKLLEALDDSSINFYLVNFANSDMVGHTGNYEAAIKAIETLDDCVGQLVTKASKLNIPVLICADHGNSDQMVYPDGTPHTSHTNAHVPVSLIHPKLENSNLAANPGDFALKDLAPTIIKILGLKPPESFTGHPIFK